jgi:hypothetical protein
MTISLTLTTKMNSNSSFSKKKKKKVATDRRYFTALQNTIISHNYTELCCFKSYGAAFCLLKKKVMVPNDTPDNRELVDFGNLPERSLFDPPV